MYKKEYHLEKLSNKSPQSLFPEQMQLAIYQMYNCICKIKVGGKFLGTGFFLKLPFPDSFNLLPVLITNNHVLNENDFSKEKVIELSLNNEEKILKLNIDYSRRIITNNIIDFTIVEIKSNDGINQNSFLEVDEFIYNNNLNEIYKNKPIYIIHFPLGGRAKFSDGIIGGITEDNKIRHFSHTEEGSSGSPIINVFNHKVMGIHKGFKEGKDFNDGITINIPIEAFNAKFKINKNYQSLKSSRN